MKRLRLNHKFVAGFLAALIILSLALFFLGVPAAYAAQDNQTTPTLCEGWGALGNPECWFYTIVRAILSVIKNAVQWVAWGLFNFVGLLIDFTLNLSGNITSGGEGNPIRQGYRIVLMVANLAIVLAFIIAAFGVMLRKDAWGKNALPRLIAVALLINFAFPFAVGAIDLSDAITQTIKNAASFNPTVFQNIISPNYIISGFGDANEATVLELISLVFLIFFAAIAIFVMFALAAMFLIRFAALAILLVLLPLAIAAAIFPGLKIGTRGNPLRTWITQFTRWLLFGPIAMFFVWLAIAMITGGGEQAAPPSQIDLTESGSIGFLAGMISALAIMLGGLIVANQMGITGAKYFYNQGQKAAGWARARAREGVDRAWSAPLRSEQGRARIERMQQTRGLRLVGRTLNTAATRAEQNIQQIAERRIQTLAQNPERLAQALPTLRGARRAAALDTLRKKNALHLIPEAAGGIARYIEDPKIEREFRAQGRIGAYEDIERTVGFNREIIEAARRSGTNSLAFRRAVEAFRRQRYQTTKHVEALQTRIFRHGDQFGLSNNIRQAVAEELAHNLVDALPEATARLRTKANAEEYANFQNVFDAYMRNFEATHLPAHLRGLGVQDRDKLAYIQANSPHLAGWASRAYPAYRRSLAGLLYAPPQQQTS